jgi:predicted 2-oxoglutarate/Fe(II)-dependent dioxygenase YbiX
MTSPWSFITGERAPLILGATSAGHFYSPDTQAGRAAVLLSLGLSGPGLARARFEAVKSAVGPLGVEGVDLVALAPQAAAVAAALGADPLARDVVVYVPDDQVLRLFEAGDESAVLIIDPAGRIVHVGRLREGADLEFVVAGLSHELRREPPSVRGLAAPVLMVPNVVGPQLRAALIDAFETGDHQFGRMAGLVDGSPAAKLDADKKHRRDIELPVGDPIHSAVLDVLANRIVPEVRRAFRCEIASADRILIARYDETGGYFRRHRDNAAPQTAFRDFAVSINLNTDEYDGGELCFPEYDDHRYAPPAGAALVFSASILHEAMEVTRGRRYVVLSFLCMAKAQAQSAAA